jgi:hypothetical protein
MTELNYSIVLKPWISLIRQLADIFNLGVFFLLQYFIAYGEFPANWRI